jgi:hypothetical protein
VRPGRACLSQISELIERLTPGIFQHQYCTVPVASKPDRSGRPPRIKLFFKGTFVLESFQAFRPGILRRRSKQEYPGHTFLSLPTIKDELIIVAERLEVVSQSQGELQPPITNTIFKSLAAFKTWVESN